MTRNFKTWAEMEKFVYQFNRDHDNHYNNVKKHLLITIVFSNESDWIRHDYSEEARTYHTSNEEKYWHGECCGRSLFAGCTAERGLVRLENCIREGWIVESITVDDEDVEVDV